MRLLRCGETTLNSWDGAAERLDNPETCLVLQLGCRQHVWVTHLLSRVGYQPGPVGRNELAHGMYWGLHWGCGSSVLWGSGAGVSCCWRPKSARLTCRREERRTDSKAKYRRDVLLSCSCHVMSQLDIAVLMQQVRASRFSRGSELIEQENPTAEVATSKPQAQDFAGWLSVGSLYFTSSRV